MGRRANEENALLQWLEQHDGVAFCRARFQLTESKRQEGFVRGGDFEDFRKGFRLKADTVSKTKPAL